MRTLRTLLTILLLGMPSIAHATSVQIMTFTGVAFPPLTDIWTEDGITATALGPIGPYSVPDSAHLDGSGPFATRIDFTTGSLFDPVSVDIRPAGSGYCRAGDCMGSPTYDPIDYIWVSGFVGDSEVTSLGFYRPADDEFETILLDHFPTIERLRVEVRTYQDLGLPGSCNTIAGCGHFNVDNVTLRAPAIPEPAAIGLFAVGLVFASSVHVSRGRPSQ